MQLIIELNDSQVKALKKLGMEETDAQKLCETATANAVRGKFNYFANKAESDYSNLYDAATRNGLAKDAEPKKVFVQRLTAELGDIKAGL